jgi:hypothetical protein
MSSSEAPSKKTCPRCKKIDTTSFSTCRHCGTKYTFQMPQAAPKEVPFGVFLFLFVGLAAAGIIAFNLCQYQQLREIYAHPEKFIGKSVTCRRRLELVAFDQQTMREFALKLVEAQKNDPHGGKGMAGIDSAAKALDTLNSGKDNSISLESGYIMGGKLHFIEGDGSSPLLVEVLAADTTSPQLSLVKVKALNGKNVGTICWMNAEQLDLSAK